MKMNRHDGDDDDHFSQSARSLGTSRASISRWDGLLTTADLGVSHNGNARSGARHLDKDAVLHQIKHNFDMETHSFRSRILEATDEATRARERIDDVHREMLRLRKKCFKLQKLLQERDATIACMQEQHDLQLPMLMHETMRSLHNAVDDNNQNQNDLDHANTMRSSVHRNRHQRSIVQEQRDDRVHEYEKQISRLYEELHQEKQKNEMLHDVLKEQKRAKAKLMKACKFARREIDALKESDLSHLLEDLEIKCRELEHANAGLQDDLDFEKTQAANARQERDDIEDELVSRRQDSSDWAARLEAKQREIERLRSQIHEQQSTLENFQQDYDLVAERTVNRSGSTSSVELQQECDLLIRALHRERARVADLEHQLQDAATHSDWSRSQTRVQQEDLNDSDDIVLQIRAVREKIRSLHHRVLEYTETQSLSSSSSYYRRSRTALPTDRPLDGSAVTLNSARVGDALSQCGADLDAMQRLMEEAFAHTLGNNCAMQ